MSYKNWKIIRDKENKEAVERKKRIDEAFAKFTPKDWYEFRNTEYEIRLESNPEAEESLNKEEEKIDSIIDGTFWNLDNKDFEELTNDQLGEKAKEILSLIKPYYRKDLVKAYQVEWTLINLSKEINPGLNYNNDLYRFEPSGMWSRQKDLIINCDDENIWYKPEADRAQENIKKAIARGVNYMPSLAGKTGYISLRKLYEDRIYDGFDYKKLKNYAYSKDLLDQVFFLYVVKRAQRQDEIAAKMLFQMYEKSVERKAIYFIKRVQEKYGVKFKPESPLGVHSIINTAKTFLWLLITGDDPESLFNYIKQLDDSRNIELIFTRRFGKKIKDLVKNFRKEIDKKVNEYKTLKGLEELLFLCVDKELGKFKQDDLNIFYKKIEQARSIAKNTKDCEKTTYRDFIKFDKLNDRLKKLCEIYYQAEDRLIQFKGYPSLDNNYFDEFTVEEKNDFELLRKKAESKAKANQYNDWHTYREFIDDDELTGTEKEMFEIIKRWENYLHTEYYPYLGVLRMSISAFANPLAWFSAVRWFNDNQFEASKNNNFSNWLLGGKHNPGALDSKLNNWLYSRLFMINVKRRIYKSEFLEGYYIIDSNNPLNFQMTSDKEIILRNSIKKYLSTKRYTKNGEQVIYECYLMHLKLHQSTYDEIAKNNGYSKRNVLRLWKGFKETLNI